MLEDKAPLVTADWRGVGMFFLLYGTVITGGILAIRRWVNRPVQEKYIALEAHIDELQKASTREHQEIYKEIDRRIGLEPGVSVKSMADGLGGRISGVEVEMGRLEVSHEKVDSSIQRNHAEMMKGMQEVSNQVAGLNATVKFLVDAQMQRIARIADHLGG